MKAIVAAAKLQMAPGQIQLCLACSGGLWGEAQRFWARGEWERGVKRRSSGRMSPERAPVLSEDMSSSRVFPGLPICSSFLGDLAPLLCFCAPEAARLRRKAFSLRSAPDVTGLTAPRHSAAESPWRSWRDRRSHGAGQSTSPYRWSPGEAGPDGPLRGAGP